MKTKAAVVFEGSRQWDVVELDLDGPRQGELLVRMVASGLCHSDDHLTTGDLPLASYPAAGGHEGAGVIEEVGPNSEGWMVGDRVVLSFLHRAVGAVGAPRECRTCVTRELERSTGRGLTVATG